MHATRFFVLTNLITLSLLPSVTDAVDPVQDAYIKASNPGGVVSASNSGDGFGLSLAISGNTLVVGAAFEDSSATGVNGSESNNSEIDSGAAYVFVRTALGWQQQAYLKASNTGSEDGFGGSVSISGDTIVVGASSEDSSATGVNGTQSNNTANDSGAAYVFVRSGTTWTQQAYLKASNTDEGDRFGGTVAIDSDTIVVGAINEQSASTGVNGTQSDDTADDAGAAYVFVRNGTTWSQQAYLKASNAEEGDGFGFVDICGNTIIAGAPTEDSAAAVVDGDEDDNTRDVSGAAYVFTRSGTTWSQQAYLKAFNPGFDHGFGSEVAVSGNTAVISAPFEQSDSRVINSGQNDTSLIAAGAVYVFVRNGTTWSQQAYLKPWNTNFFTDPGFDTFGFGIDIQGDTVIVGAPGESS
ncbi:MAG: integrin, partial [Verrucomicrobiota bacterium]